MNERIKELAEQAELYAVSDNSSMLFDVWKKRYTEKFAELIIQECCALIAPSQELKKDPSFPYMGGAEGVELLDGSVRLIKEHFGVEE